MFFPNTQCLNCGTALGYEPTLAKVVPIIPSEREGLWRIATRTAGTREYRRCANLETAAVCNWLVRSGAAADAAGGLCVSCRLNRTIPDLSIERNALHWGIMEAAKRRVISVLAALELPLASRIGEDPIRGLAFDLLAPVAGGPPVMTGHADGIVTINVDEADDAVRESVRAQMHEPYRTLVGHFRHELGHYYWYRLVQGSKWLEGFRELFGDERADYAEALQRNYSNGPDPAWPSLFVSAYASIHPWEDWAETWAHYLHIVDTLGTAYGFGMQHAGAGLPFDRFTSTVLWRPEHATAGEFLSMLNEWVELTAVMNELSRSMGQQDLYPFALPKAAIAKLQFVHALVGAV